MKKSYLKDCFVKDRDEAIFYSGNEYPGFWLDGYVVVPKERFEELLPEIRKWIAKGE